MNEHQAHSLERFEAFYGWIEDAIADEDADLVSELVASRDDALQDLLHAFSGRHLPEAARARIEGAEAHVRGRLVRFYDSILVRLSEERRMSYATARYQEALP
ncbi:MAG: hypothetical protein JNJ59_26680 [Deltaproteobacteria bacterium]|jgi:hypothetical protein|nr:hypothetical protein [Deltaproteobacteria bacterium]